MTQESRSSLLGELDHLIARACEQLESQRPADQSDIDAALSAVMAFLDQLRPGTQGMHTALERLDALARQAQDERGVAAMIAVLGGLAHIEAGHVAAGCERVEAGIDALCKGGSIQTALHMAEHLVRTLRRIGAIDMALTVGMRLYERAWPEEAQQAALGLRVTVGETALLGGRGDLGEAHLQAVEEAVEAQSGEVWTPLYQIHMARAFHAQQIGAWADARAYTDGARALAVAHVDPQRYWAAAQLMTTLAEEQGDRLGAYATLVRAVKSLEHLLGSRFAETGRAALAALRERWGEHAYQAVARELIARAAAGTRRE